jgi:translocation and assembly module TamA
MKKIILNFIAIICYTCCTISYAAELTYKIQGIENPLLANVQARLRDELPNPQQLTDKQIHSWHQQSEEQIRHALEPFGYFKPIIHSSLIQQTNNWIATYQINPGPALKITHLKISLTGAGKNDVVLNQLLDHFPLESGQILTMNSYNQAKQQLFNTALAQGYLDAKLTTHTILIDRHHYTANITLELASGPRYYFGPITFQQTTFDDTFLNGYLRFQPGQAYSPNRLLASQDALKNSNYFQQVQINSAVNPHTQQVPITFHVVPRPAQQYTVGTGFGSDTGIRGLLGWEWRQITRTGQRMSAFIQASQVQNSLQAVYHIPGANPRISEYQINASVSKDNLPVVTSFTKQIGLAYVINKKHWQQNLFLNFMQEDFKFDEEDNWHHVHILTPGISWSHTQADNMIYAHNGYRISFRLQGAFNHFFSNSGFFQAETQGKYIKSFGKDNENRIVMRSTIGYTAVDDLPNFPATLRFYTGGTQSVRSYHYQEFGPGRNLITGSFEYQRRIVGNWNATVFYDVGNAFNNFPAHLNRGAGIGILWASPLGPMQLTVGQAIDDPSKPIRVQFSMGPDFA